MDEYAEKLVNDAFKNDFKLHMRILDTASTSGPNAIRRATRAY